MFVSIVEGTVKAEREDDLRAAWDEARTALPAGFIESFLLRTDEGTWRIGTLWESREALMAMRASGGKPAALVMFGRAATRPTVSLWDVDRHVSAST